MTKRANENYPQVEVADRAELRQWLARHHRRSTPIWLVHGKKAAGDRYLPYDDIVEEVLCFGWIDSLPRALDAKRTMLLLSPRKPGSAWSKPNRERVERLIATGQMQPSALAKVDAAKADGSWDFLRVAESGAVPADLATALDATSGARSGYEGLSAAARRRIVEYLMRAKQDRTRADRIAKVVAAAVEGKDPLAWKPANRS